MTFTLRAWTLDDATSLTKYANNPKIAANLTNAFPYPYTMDNAIAFINMAKQKTLPNILAIDINGEACGGIGIHPQSDVYCKNAELGYWLAEPYWGKGIVTQAVVEIVDYGFKNFDITRIFARPYGHNIASQKVLEKAGFKLEASFEKTLFKNNEFVDELIFAIRKPSS